MLSKSKNEYLKNKGWSSNLFFNIAQVLIEKLENDNFNIDFGRTVVYLLKNNKKLKIYVHYNGRSKEYITLVDSKGMELKTFHYTEDVIIIYNYIIKYFNL